MKIFKLMQDLRAIGWFEYQMVDEGLETEHLRGELVCCGGLFTAYFRMMEDCFDVELYAETKIGTFKEVRYEKADSIVNYINDIIASTR
jgi:hypothetical protein